MASRKEVFITDLPARVVGKHKPAAGVGKGWIGVEYETEAFHGEGLATGYESGAPDLTLRLDLKGSYVLYLAVGAGDSLRVWLDGQAGFREYTTQHGGNNVQEIRLHRADLTGRRLHIATIPASPGRQRDIHTFLAYIRAVPTDHAPKKSARNLVASNDGFSWIALDGMATLRDVTKQFEPYRDSDFFRMLWCPTGADFTGNHLTRVGTVTPFDTTHAYRRCDRLFAQTTKRILKGGGDILAAAVAAARAVGMEIHFYIRPEAFFCGFPYDGVFTSKFLDRNPGLRCRDEFGREVMRMRYAFGEVQDHMLAYIEELLGYDPDGLCFAFNRSLPMMICEDPVIHAFEKRCGRTPRLPAEVDSAEMLAVRHELLAGFIERVHTLLAKGRKKLSCITDLDHERARGALSMDLEMLLKRGFIESICVAGACPTSEYWQRLRDSYPVPIYSSVHYDHEAGTAMRDPFDHKTQARGLKNVLDSGFAGTFWWDTENMHLNPYNWHVLRHGGTPEYLDRVLADDPATKPTFRKLVEVQGVRHDRYDPGRSY